MDSTYLILVLYFIYLTQNDLIKFSSILKFHDGVWTFKEFYLNLNAFSKLIQNSVSGDPPFIMISLPFQESFFQVY